MDDYRKNPYEIRAYNADGEELRLQGERGATFGMPVASIFDVVAALGTLGFGWVDWEEDGESECFPVSVIEVRHYQAPAGRGQWQCNLLERIVRPGRPGQTQ